MEQISFSVKKYLKIECQRQKLLRQYTADIISICNRCLDSENAGWWVSKKESQGAPKQIFYMLTV